MPLPNNNFMPLYRTGLCEAVITTPPVQPSSLRLTPTQGVVTSPKSTTSTPTPARPAVTADLSICPLGRESVPIQTAGREPGLLSLRKVPNAQPYSVATVAVRLSPMIPRIPLTVIINCSAIGKFGSIVLLIASKNLCSYIQQSVYTRYAIGNMENQSSLQT